jgi:hypothetical protein
MAARKQKGETERSLGQDTVPKDIPSVTYFLHQVPSPKVLII